MSPGDFGPTNDDFGFSIGSVRVPNPVVAAPMAGVTNLPFRILAKEMGCGLVCTEMISDMALLFDSKVTLRMLSLAQEERPVSVQLFGGSPESLSWAARIVEEHGADIIDINMGCPAPKIVRGGGGSSLLREPDLARRIIEAVVEAASVPVTVKLRTGWDESCINIVEMARLAQAAGARAITVHGRTRVQHYSGKADWGAIARAVEAVDIPVIGNGDIWAPQDARAMMETTGCAGVAIARGALGNPWIFRRTVHYLRTGELLPEPSVQERVQMAKRHLRMLVDHKGEYIGVREMRKHAAWYVKGIHGAAALRVRINAAETEEEMARILEEVSDEPAGGTGC